MLTLQRQFYKNKQHANRTIVVFEFIQQSPINYMLVDKEVNGGHK